MHQKHESVGFWARHFKRTFINSESYNETKDIKYSLLLTQYKASIPLINSYIQLTYLVAMVCEQVLLTANLLSAVEPQNAPYTICSLEVHIVYPAYTICSPLNREHIV